MSSNNLPSIIPTSTKIEKQSPLQLYLKEISRYPLLSPEEELELARRHFDQGDVVAAHKLVTSNLRLVVKLAYEFNKIQNSIFLDIVQEGNAGLMHAVKKFNPYKGVKLSTYASWWIKAYILKYIMENKSQVKIGTTNAQRKLFFNLNKETEKFLKEYDSLDVKLLAQSLEVKEKELVDMQQRLQSADVSLDAPISSSSPLTHASVIAADIMPIDELLAKEELNHLFKEHLVEYKELLQGRELEIFNDRLMNENPLTLQQLADKYGVTRERVRQLEARTIKKLKDFVQSKGQIEIDV